MLSDMRTIIILILIAFTFSGCSSDEEAILTDPDYSEYIIENSVDTEINFYAEEIYTSSEVQAPVLKLKLITTEIFPCVNYGLLATEFIRGSELIVRVEEIIIPELCLTLFGPAVTYIDLPQDISKLTFLNGNKVDNYSIDINEQKISLSSIENSFTTSLHDETFRIPENSFAYICGTSTISIGIYKDFSRILEENADFIEFTFDGEGRIPFRETTGNSVNHPAKYFKYSDMDEFNNLANILNNYSTENIEENSGVSISIIGWNNNSFYSWLEN